MQTSHQTLSPAVQGESLPTSGMSRVGIMLMTCHLTNAVNSCGLEISVVFWVGLVFTDGVLEMPFAAWAVGGLEGVADGVTFSGNAEDGGPILRSTVMEGRHTTLHNNSSGTYLHYNDPR